MLNNYVDMCHLLCVGVAGEAGEAGTERRGGVRVRGEPGVRRATSPSRDRHERDRRWLKFYKIHKH